MARMPELPDVCVYLEALDRRVVGQRLESVRIASPFVLRSYDPPIVALEDRVVRGTRRIGKRIVLEFGDDLFLVIHLMIAGRLRWRTAAQKPGIGSKLILATLQFPNGTLYFTEAGSKKRASLFVARGEAALSALDPGGLETLEATPEEFDAALRRE